MEMHLTSPPAGHTLSLLKCGFFSRPAPGHRDVRHVPTQATSTAGGPSGRSVGQRLREKKALAVHHPSTPRAPSNAGCTRRGSPGGRRGPRGSAGQSEEVMGANRQGASAHTPARPSPPRSQVWEGPPTRFLWRPETDAPEAARPGPAMAAREPGPRCAEHRPRHSLGAGSGRPRWPQTWPLDRDRLPKERPAWGAGRGARAWLLPAGSGRSAPEMALARLRSPKRDPRRERRRPRHPWGCVLGGGRHGHGAGASRPPLPAAAPGESPCRPLH